MAPNTESNAVASETDPSVTKDVDMETLNRIVVPMPAFTDPHNPMAQSGSVNLALDEHPVEHSADYAGLDQEDVAETKMTDGPQNGMSEGAASLSDMSLPENREEWSREQWIVAANYYNVSASGTKDAIRKRVEEHEATLEAAPPTLES